MRHTTTTAQKAVVNSVIKSNIAMDPDGMHCLFMDNQYQCTDLAILLCDKYQIRSCDTTRRDRNGWENIFFDMNKKAERGALIRKFDPLNELLFIQ